MIDPLHNHLQIAICDDAAEAKRRGFDYQAVNQTAPDTYKPVQVQQVVVVLKGTEKGNPTVDFVLQDATGQRFVFMVTGNLLKSIPC